MRVSSAEETLLLERQGGRPETGDRRKVRLTKGRKRGVRETPDGVTFE